MIQDRFVNKSTQDVIDATDSAIIADAELVGKESGIRIHMIIVQNSNDARKILNQNGKKKTSEFSSLNDTESYVTGGKNSELDDLLDEIQKEAN